MAESVFTDANFKQDVLAEKSMPVLVDFWAPWCIDPQTPILTKYGYLRALEIKAGMEVMTINPNTHVETLRQVRKTRIIKNVFSKKITLETGRSLIGAIDHLVLTRNGFKSLGEINRGESILVDPKQHDTYFTSQQNTIIVKNTENNFTNKQLKKQNLLPLKADHPQLLILARLLGFVMTDGYLYEDKKHNIYEIHFFVGLQEDAEQIAEDLQNLGFEKLEIKKQVKQRKIGQREFTMHILRCRNLNRSLFFLLKALGAPVGRKKNQAYFIPDWIMEAEKTVKKAFLSGWIGGDGCKIDYYNKGNNVSSHNAGFKVNAIEFHKEKELEKEGLLYAKQLALLLEECGVQVSQVISRDDEDGVIISLRIATDYRSLLNLAHVEYAYAHTKNKSVPFIREFLAYRLFERESYAEVKQTVLQQIALGRYTQDIAKNLEIPVSTVVSWKYNTTAKATHPSLDGEAKFDLWFKARIAGDLLWEKVRDVVDAGVRDVVGITVDSPHTIITNGFASHNCGPCKIISPIVEELAKEYEGKIKVGKLNVDENPNTAAEYGIMSIPTLAFFKNGQVVKTIIGAQPKEALKKAIDEMLQ